LTFKENFGKDPIKTIDNDADSKYKNTILPYKALLAFFCLKKEKKISDENS